LLPTVHFPQVRHSFTTFKGRRRLETQTQMMKHPKRPSLEMDHHWRRQPREKKPPPPNKPHISRVRMCKFGDVALAVPVSVLKAGRMPGWSESLFS
jgi:hypothetical protein